MKKTQKQKKESQAKSSADLLDTCKKQMLSLPEAAAFLGIYGRTLWNCFGERAKDIVFVILEKGTPERFQPRKRADPKALLMKIYSKEGLNLPPSTTTRVLLLKIIVEHLA
ncbi:MAG: hypothetical protein LBT05_10375 [Planctomycetaceae bacterium]|nr:hypothetical protein [Planctomycetaceae bacterium]